MCRTILWFTMLCSCSVQIGMTDANRFALEYSAREYTSFRGISHHSCDWVSGLMTTWIWNDCYGLMGNGLVVRFKCHIEEGCKQ